jgi:hypothetical protein
MDLDETETRNDSVDEDQQQFYRPTDSLTITEFWSWAPEEASNQDWRADRRS